MKRVPPFGFKVPVPKVGFGMAALLLVFFWMLAVAAFYGQQIVQSVEGPEWVFWGLQGLAAIAGGLGAFLTIAVAWRVLVKVAAAAWPLVRSLLSSEEVAFEAEPAPVDIVDEAPETEAKMDDLTLVMATLAEVDLAEVDRVMVDIKRLSYELVGQAEKVAQRAADYWAKVDNLDEAAQALQARDEFRLVNIAGKFVWDQDLERALGSEVSFDNVKFWRGVARMISQHRSAIEVWAGVYEDYSASLLRRVLETNNNLTRIAAARDFIEGSFGVVDIRNNLYRAAGLLQMNAPGVRSMMPEVGDKMLAYSGSQKALSGGK